jgi:hypothetical protein
VCCVGRLFPSTYNCNQYVMCVAPLIFLLNIMICGSLEGEKKSSKTLH